MKCGLICAPGMSTLGEDKRCGLVTPACGLSTELGGDRRCGFITAACGLITEPGRDMKCGLGILCGLGISLRGGAVSTGCSIRTVKGRNIAETTQRGDTIPHNARTHTILNYSGMENSSAQVSPPPPSHPV